VFGRVFLGRSLAAHRPGTSTAISRISFPIPLS
jgi:hypothetical protein